MSGKKPSSRPPLQVILPANGSPVSAIAGLVAALQFAAEAAIFPDRLKVDSESKFSRLDAFAQALLREAKNAAPEGISDSAEASGISVAIAFINEIVGCIRDEIEGS